MKLPLKIRRQFNANSVKYANGCAGKVKHSSKRHAIAARVQIIRDAPTREDWAHGVMLVVYKCNGHYHLGH